jgi:hypothetical protein
MSRLPWQRVNAPVATSWMMARLVAFSLSCFFNLLSFRLVSYAEMSFAIMVVLLYEMVACADIKYCNDGYTNDDSGIECYEVRKIRVHVVSL